MKIPAKYSDFIVLYNETFKYLSNRFSRLSLDEYWDYMSENFITELRILVKEKGLNGMKEYWEWSLKDEDIDYKINLDLRRAVFTLKVDDCSAIKTLMKKKAKIWPFYCEHCRALYSKAVAVGGFNLLLDYKTDNRNIPTGKCVLTIK